MSESEKHPYLSVIIPFYNEVDNIERMWQVVYKVLQDLDYSFEVIFIDDGSTDGTREKMRQLAADYPELKVILFRANFGQSAAMNAGFEKSRGDIVIAMDGDLQNDPRDIAKMVLKLEQGYDVVSGWRKHRQDKLITRKLPSRIANRIICSITDVSLHDTGCSLKAFRGPLLRRIYLYGEFHRFIPALIRMEGARITELSVRHHPRKYGRSKYNISRTFRVIMDLLTIRLLMKHLHHPLAFFAPFSFLCGLAGFVTLVHTTYQLVRGTADAAAINIEITLTILLWAAAFLFISLGLIGKLIVGYGERQSFSMDLM